MPYLLIILVAATRFLPHPPNVTCVAALGLFAGAYGVGKARFLVPVAVLGVSDVMGQMLSIPGMGFYSPVVMLGVYAGMLLSVPLGRWISRQPLNRWRHAWRIPAASVLASTLFFIFSNLAVWAAGWYPMTATGLAACFSAAIPFYGLTLVGDLAFSTSMFAAASLAACWTGISNRSPIQRLSENRSRSRFLLMDLFSLAGNRSL